MVKLDRTGAARAVKAPIPALPPDPAAERVRQVNAAVSDLFTLGVIAPATWEQLAPRDRALLAPYSPGRRSVRELALEAAERNAAADVETAFGIR